jgi:hypothetical protein
MTAKKGKKKKGKPYADTPSGGRAFQRIQQDRLARGLDELPTPPSTKRPAKKKKKS